MTSTDVRPVDGETFDPIGRHLPDPYPFLATARVAAYDELGPNCVPQRLHPAMKPSIAVPVVRGCRRPVLDPRGVR
jgi:hypothetical protein